MTHSCTFRDLVDIRRLESLLQKYTIATGYTTGLHDQLTNEVLIRTGWRRICTHFHRHNEVSAVRCRASNRQLTEALEKPGEIRIGECGNGLVDACTPIIIAGRHLANLFTGQVLFSPPDRERFRRQARDCGYDEAEYLEALAAVPVVAREKFENHIRFLADLATAVAEIGLAAFQLRQSEKRCRFFFEGFRDAFFIAGEDGRFVELNPAGVRLFGYDSFAEMKRLDIGRDICREPADWRRYIELMRRQGYVHNFEFVARRKDGSDVIVEVTSSPAIRDDEWRVGVFHGIIRDITEKRMLENQLAQIRKMESIGQLAGGIAHDFNNLLSVITSNAELAQLHLDRKEQLEKDLEAILDAGRRAENLVSQLLAFSRRQPCKPEPLDLNRTLAEIEKLLRRLLPKDIRIEVILADSLPKILADTTQIEQILVNLVVNARDALAARPEGGEERRIVIETGWVELGEEYVKFHSGSRTGEFVCFSVSDNGVGIEEEVREKIFEPFFTTKPKNQGTGLGLATVYGIVKQNNGFIYVYSEPGQGTSFKVYWPVCVVDGGTREKDGGIGECRGGNETILVVEDEPEVRAFVEETLRNLGYTVYAAGDGARALELLGDDALHCDLMITDLVMPGLNGRDLARRAQALRPRLKVLFTSGYPNSYVVKNQMLGEEAEFLQKPYSLQRLGALVRRILDDGEEA